MQDYLQNLHLNFATSHLHIKHYICILNTTYGELHFSFLNKKIMCFQVKQQNFENYKHFVLPADAATQISRRISEKIILALLWYGSKAHGSKAQLSSQHKHTADPEQQDVDVWQKEWFQSTSELIIAQFFQNCLHWYIINLPLRQKNTVTALYFKYQI